MEFAEIVAALRYGMLNLFRFSGRDGRRLFLPWGISVFGLAFVASAAWMQSVMLSGMMRMQAAEPQGTAETEPIFAETLAQLKALWLPLSVISALAVLLLAAAVTRRLHDRTRSGFWGLVPVPFLIFSISQTPKGAEYAVGAANPTGPNMLMTMAPALFWLSLIVLAVMLSGKSTPGPNRYGETTREAV